MEQYRTDDRAGGVDPSRLANRILLLAVLGCVLAPTTIPGFVLSALALRSVKQYDEAFTRCKKVNVATVLATVALIVSAVFLVLWLLATNRHL